MARARKKPSLPAPFDDGADRRFSVAACNLASAKDNQGRVVAGPRATGRILVPGARVAERSILLSVAGDVNNRQQRRHIHPLDAMEAKRLLNAWQAAAGRKLLDAWEATMTGPGCDLSQERVDSTSNPEARTTALIIKQARFADMRGGMPKESRAVVEHVVLNGKYLRCGLARNGDEMAVMLEQLRIALDVLADYLGLR
ncbi:MAG: hypothetical protein COB08_005540 [Rhodobacteraceae bacterium]|nr:hypothetical protein [Paracoccaceae bacterium]